MTKCRKWMREYAINHKFQYKQKKNDNLIIELICKDPNCAWRVYVRKVPNQLTARLRRMVNKHTCGSNDKDQNRLAHAGWIANELETGVRNHKEYKPKDIQAEMWLRFGIKVSYKTAWRSNVICHERLYGSYSEGYRMCPELCNQLLSKNPGSICQWSRTPVTNHFVSLCVALKCSLDGFVEGCRPIVGLDGSFLKGKYGGCVLSTIGLDGDNGLFPIGIYICSGETYDAWSQFLKILEPHLRKHPLPLTFISDRAKGLVESVAEVFPESHHRFCFRHLYKNFKKDFKGKQLETLTWGAAKAYKKEEYERWMKQLLKDKKEAAEWFDDETRLKENWARSYFDTTTKCEHITNNFSESWNKMILSLREMPLVKLVEKYVLLVMALMYTRRNSAKEMEGVMVPRVYKAIESVKKKYNHYTTSGSTDWLYVAVNQWGASWTVDINNHTCSCCEWQISGLPCVHAMAVILPRRNGWERYCSTMFSVESYKKAYAGIVVPMEDSQYWPEPQHKICPPPAYRPAGRPKKNRYKDVDEGNPEKRKQKRCSKCGVLGHNKKSCKGAPAPKGPGGKRIRVEAEGPVIQGGVPLVVPVPPVPKVRQQARKKARGGGKRKFIPPRPSPGAGPSTPAT